ncbi:hypothetical protein J8L85_13495 [Maribacter sp. MMG018]|uniref:hypothetical protein n=1 Tax=Maribacter sp. MMG018 TaxID=2822688 RepID=UPI001B368465|nr:hypothetical protein [Maribacter sp. MMG018]MBQ4915463.1 hypothetical protein [Maribacter sp. MMG018]
MIKNIKNVLYCSTFFLIFGCGSDDSTEEEVVSNGAQGNITLSGDETSELGTSLTVANIEVANASLTGTDKSVILMSENISVVDDEFVYDDDQNGFVIVAADFSTGGSADIDKSISMTIVKDGEEYRHACSSPYLNFFTACGDGFAIDFEGKSVTFDGTTVINTDDDTILTMDGTITWN